MTRKIQLLLLAAALLLAARVTAATNHYALDTGDFSEIVLNDELNIVYRHNPDSAGYAVFDCTPGFAHAITFTNNKGKLKINIDTDTDVPLEEVTITLYSSALTKVTNHTDALIEVHQPVCGSKITLDVVGNGLIKAFGVRALNVSASVKAGSGHVYVDGQTTVAKLNLVSAGAIEAGKLQAKEVKCWMVGTGSIDCAPEKKLTVYGGSSGTVYYTGDPEVKTRCVGVKLQHVDN